MVDLRAKMDSQSEFCQDLSHDLGSWMGNCDERGDVRGMDLVELKMVKLLLPMIR